VCECILNIGSSMGMETDTEGSLLGILAHLLYAEAPERLYECKSLFYCPITETEA
jgi:hypothetical protein